jgi:hypothetical protein
MAESIKKEKVEFAIEVVAEVIVAFTKMKNTSGRTLQLSCGAVKDGETVDFNPAEFSVLWQELEGVK